MVLSSCCVAVMQYSAWLDQHKRDEILTNIRSALEASPAESKGEAAIDGLLPLMLKLCTD